MDSPANPSLKDTLCFPLYVCSREAVKKYRPFLDEIELTYTQYIVMLLLWEYGAMSAKELGERLYLDSGTLTPVLKSLQEKELIIRSRSERDERVLMVSLTGKGSELKEKAGIIPETDLCSRLEKNEIKELHRLLYKLLEGC